MVQKPNKKIIYLITSFALFFTAIIVIEGWNYHEESIEHDSGPINRFLNFGKVDDVYTVLMHTKKGIITGYISVITGNSVTIQKNKLKWGVSTDGQTQIREGDSSILYTDLHVNDWVTVLGQASTDTPIVKAVLIRKN